ncbi:sugar O-acetyltransferase [Chitinispirillales bacterium ANBcel5]|uniref:sugar O-acetyltransferase n=1 Tax=Cellulosispirillum alkaliphilum TaxID=3039283 RepID=UPI002A52C059|nr:sugar O-acetyltransferase [Chitinispirillales bacterium ANBcel5]
MKSEKEKMLSGELYSAFDEQLSADRKKARMLLHRLNYLDYGNESATSGILKELMPDAGEELWIEPPFYCDYGYNIITGKNVYFNFNCVLLNVMEIRIGSNVLFGPGVHIYTATHPIDAQERKKGLESAKPVTIGDDCWIGGGAIINPGLCIGNRCVIGSGAVVTKSVPDDTIVVGNPAKPVEKRDS